MLAVDKDIGDGTDATEVEQDALVAEVLGRVEVPGVNGCSGSWRVLFASQDLSEKGVAPVMN